MKIIQSNLLKNFLNLKHGFTCRDGGVSKKPYNSLNLALHVEDNIADVTQNHKLLANTLNYNKKTVVHMKQIHSDILHVVDENDNFDNPPICDALITDKLNTPLMVMVADCSPILFYDDMRKVIAVAHAGRQGAFKNIVSVVLNSFRNNFNSNIANLHVAIGASICQNCYEVGAEIYDEAKELKLDYALTLKDRSYYLDIRAILKKQLLHVGVSEKNIEISDECSCCLNKKYFSYRADGITGRFAGVISL